MEAQPTEDSNSLEALLAQDSALPPSKQAAVHTWLLRNLICSDIYNGSFDAQTTRKRMARAMALKRCGVPFLDPAIAKRVESDQSSAESTTLLEWERRRPGCLEALLTRHWPDAVAGEVTTFMREYVLGGLIEINFVDPTVPQYQTAILERVVVAKHHHAAALLLELGANERMVPAARNVYHRTLIASGDIEGGVNTAIEAGDFLGFVDYVDHFDSPMGLAVRGALMNRLIDAAKTSGDDLNAGSISPAQGAHPAMGPRAVAPRRRGI